MVNSYTGHDLQMLHYAVAPWMIGCFLDLITQGVLFCQFNNYISWYREDKLHLRCMVYVLIVLTTLKCIDSCAVTWISFVTYFGDLEGATLLAYVTWWQAGVPLMGACINFYAQLYFLYRLSAISMRSWIVWPLGLVIVFAWLSIVVATVYISMQDADPIEHWFAAHLSATFASDVLITGTTAYFLLQSKKNSLKQTQTLIDTLIRITWQSAAPAAVCATINLILSQAVAQEFLVSTIPNMLLPKIYSIAMMWTINSRKNIRLVNASGKTSSHSDGVSGPLSRGVGARTGEVELSRIQVHKQTETVSHVEWARPRHSDDIKNPDSYYGHAQPTITVQETDSGSERRHHGIV